MKKNHHIILGQEGEEVAAQFLVNKGYAVLYRQWKFKHKEIDIIAKQNDTIVIVEVKTRTQCYSAPGEVVDLKKQQFLIEAAEYFMEQYPETLEIRFDVISIIKRNNRFEILHIENAFIPQL